MRTTTAMTTALTLVFMAGIVLGQNVSVTDYDVAVSSARDLRIDVNYNLALEGDSTTVDQGNGAVAVKRFYSSLPFEWSVDATSIVTEVDGDFTSLVNAGGRFKKFLRDESDFFGGGAVKMSYSSESDIFGRDEPRTDVTAIGGYGRFIDATPLAKAVRIEAFLIDENILRGHLPKEDILELAYLIEKEQEYKDKYGATYKPQWYEEMEGVMKKSGLLREEGLGGLGTLRIDEVLFRERVQSRFYGYDVTVGVGVIATTPDTTIDRGDGIATAGFRWSRPVAWRTQFDQQFLLTTPLTSDFGKQLDASLISRFIYELSNRIDFSATHILDFTKIAEVAAGADDQVIDNTVRFSFLFYIENHINLSMNLGFDSFEDQDVVTTFSTSLGVDVW